MKDLAQKFLSDAERARVTEAVKAAEKLTAGEIVVMIISGSYHYPMANVIGAAVFSIPFTGYFGDRKGVRPALYVTGDDFAGHCKTYFGRSADT